MDIITTSGGWEFLFRYLHFLAGITWIGVLYYFNFIQTPFFGSELGGQSRSAMIRGLVPNALWWFRWGALVTWLTGATYLLHTGQFDDAVALGMMGESVNQYALTIGIGAWLGTIMLFNVWGLIWPAQKKILGMVEASADEIAKARTVALMASRSNTLMSIPVVMSMVGAHHGFFM